jgi:hypothetical protein
VEALGELAAARPDLDILTTDAYLELNGRRVRRCYEDDWPFETADQRRGILERNFVFGLAAVRRERLLAADGFDEGIRWTADWDCWIRMILAGSRVGLVTEPLALYRVHDASLSASRVNHVRGRIQTLQRAAARSGLSQQERATVASSTAAQERELAALELRAAVLARPPDLRHRLFRAAIRRDLPGRTRVKAAAAAAAPALAARYFRRSQGTAWIGAAGIQGHANPPTRDES